MAVHPWVSNALLALLGFQWRCSPPLFSWQLQRCLDPIQSKCRLAVSSPEQGRVVLDLGRRQISVQRQGQTLGPWPVAIGGPNTPTPSGLFKVENMMMNPQYQSTKSGKLHPKRGLQSPLGHRWIGFLRSGPNQFGIHGTPLPHWVKTRSAVSNGCVRMLNAHVQQLYDHVEVGMAVEIMR